MRKKEAMQVASCDDRDCPQTSFSPLYLLFQHMRINVAFSFDQKDGKHCAHVPGVDPFIMRSYCTTVE